MVEYTVNKQKTGIKMTINCFSYIFGTRESRRWLTAKQNLQKIIKEAKCKRPSENLRAFDSWSVGSIRKNGFRKALDTQKSLIVNTIKKICPRLAGKRFGSSCALQVGTISGYS